MDDTRKTDWITRERKISPLVAETAGLHWLGDELAIPVRNLVGQTIFEKIRRSPDKHDGPKYRYTLGSGAELFGMENVNKWEKDALVIITEGELDALVMRSLGYNAVSSTGGSGTWKQEWERYLNMVKPVIFYDADGAGMSGAMRVAGLLPGAEVAFVPVEYGKDPSEVAASGEEGVAAIHKAIEERIRLLVPSPQIAPHDRHRELGALCNHLVQLRKEVLKDREKTPFHVDLALEWVNEELDATARNLEVRGRKKVATNGEFEKQIENAKTYPIAKLLKVGRDGKAHCVFHKEKTASMHVYKDNHAFCFPCNRKADAIDIYQALKNCDFRTAVAALQ